MPFICKLLFFCELFELVRQFASSVSNSNKRKKFRAMEIWIPTATSLMNYCEFEFFCESRLSGMLRAYRSSRRRQALARTCRIGAEGVSG